MRLELGSRLEEEQRRISTTLEHERELGAKQADPRLVELAQRPRIRQVEELRCGLERSRLELGDGRVQRSSSTSGRVQGERRGPLEERRRRGQTAPRLGPTGGALQLVGELLVGPGGSLRQVPAASVGSRIRSVSSARARCAAWRSSTVADQ